MLFDDRDLRVFDNADSRNYFKEILQSYYSQNYRATVVLLYSFVIYDLFIKLQNMANEGEEKAFKKLGEINNMISDDEKYSKVENSVIQFFKDNCALYFDNFIADIDYLRDCRNKCAHLKVNDNSLYVPSDYHARMLICSMYDHILSVKAPFITDLFSIAKTDVEGYSCSVLRISHNDLDESVKKTIVGKYLKRMTYDSFKKSYKTFIRLLFVTDSEDCKKNTCGLYAFAFSMTDYAVKNGLSCLFKDGSILATFSRINVDALADNTSRTNALISIITTFPVVMDIIRDNEDVFNYISRKALEKPWGLKDYRAFYPRDQRTVYTYFKEHKSLQDPNRSEILYGIMKDCNDFDLAEYSLLMLDSIPSFNGFSDADAYMGFLKEHLSELGISDVKEIMKHYSQNSQCTNRSRHAEEFLVLQEYIKEKSNPETGEDLHRT